MAPWIYLDKPLRCRRIHCVGNHLRPVKYWASPVKTSRCEVETAIAENGFHRGYYRDSRNTGGNSFPQKSNLSILPELIKVIKRARCFIRHRIMWTIVSLFNIKYNIKLYESLLVVFLKRFLAVLSFNIDSLRVNIY